MPTISFDNRKNFLQLRSQNTQKTFLPAKHIIKLSTTHHKYRPYTLASNT